MSKICFYLESYYVGGLDTFTIDLLNNWPDKNDELVLLCNKSHTALELYNERFVKSNIKLILHDLPLVPEKQIKLKEYFGEGLLYKITSFILQYSYFVYYLLFSYKILNLKKFDKLMIINGGYPGGNTCRAVSIVWGMFSGKKSLHNYHNYAVKPKRINRIIENLIDKLVCKYTYFFVSVSKSCSDSIRNRPAMSSFQNLKFIHNGINYNIIKSKVCIKDELQIDRTAKLCIMLSTYEKRKGHLFLFEAFSKICKECSEAVLICCGYGTDGELELMREKVKELGLQEKIFILGFRHDAMELLDQADILLISSIGFESFGLTAIEAMKYKKVIVSTNVGGLSEVIKNNHGGYLFDKTDVDGYANKTIELLKDANLRIEQGALGYNRFINNFQVDRMASEYSNLMYNI